MRLVTDVWPDVPQHIMRYREDDITKILYQKMTLRKEARDLPFLIMMQTVEVAGALGQSEGRLDFAFYATGGRGAPSEKIYFGLECKILNLVRNGKVIRMGSQYVKDGLARFIDGKYAHGFHHGGMLGYVMDGDMGRAIANVADNIKRRRATLGMDEPGAMMRSTLLPGLRNTCETHHRRPSNLRPILIQHLFVDGLRR
jgi:hypothetical protein